VKLPDGNILIYASAPDSQHHETARSWLERALSGSETVAFAIAALLAYVRITTKRSVAETPLTPVEAFDQIEEWLAQAPASIVHPGRRHIRICRELLEAAGTAGNLTGDAHLAALAIEHGATLASFDADFHRFAGLDFEYLR
jgi:toxin-antitoxin system PIN domain toxin